MNTLLTILARLIAPIAGLFRSPPARPTGGNEITCAEIAVQIPLLEAEFANPATALRRKVVLRMQIRRLKAIQSWKCP